MYTLFYICPCFPDLTFFVPWSDLWPALTWVYISICVFVYNKFQKIHIIFYKEFSTTSSNTNHAEIFFCCILWQYHRLVDGKLYVKVNLILDVTRCQRQTFTPCQRQGVFQIFEPKVIFLLQKWFFWNLFCKLFYNGSVKFFPFLILQLKLKG
jgi:hypothetical protein